MKAKTAKPSCINESFRCQRRTRNGRCRMLAVDRAGKFCAEHLPKHPTRPTDFSDILTLESCGFQTAQGINYSLGDLYVLLAQGRISTRRASVLTRISCALLRTLTAIDNDRSPKAWRELGAAPADPYDEDDATQDSTESNPPAAAQTANDKGASAVNETQPRQKPVPPGKEPLPATIDGYLAAVTKLKLNPN